jgi:flagellar motility protein MotE (MotC chaperone)
MKKILISLCIALVMFGLSATASWIWNQRLAAEAASASSNESSDEVSESDDSASAVGTAQEPPASGPGRRVTADAPTGRLGPLERGDARMPSQGSYAAGFDDTVQIASSLRERMTAVRERETQLAQRQAQVELILKDIRAQRTAIEELRKQVNEEFSATEEQLAAAERQRSQIDAQQQSLQERVTEVDGVEKEGTKRLAGVYDGMAADRAAKILEHMVNSGNMDTAVKLLGSMRERQAAKVLGEFEDTSLAAQLSERLKGLKKPVTPPKG